MTPLLDGWWVHKEQTWGKAHRLRSLPAFPEYAKVLCGTYWLLASARPPSLKLGRCLRCEKLQHRYTTHDEVKGA